MTNRALASALLGILGIWLGLGSISMISDAYSGWLSGILMRNEGPLFDAKMLPPLALSLGIALIGAFVLHIVPAIMVFRRRYRWADQLVPQDGTPEVTSSPPLLYVVGLRLLGIYIAVIGTQAFIANLIIAFIGSEFTRADALARLAGSAVLPAAGLGLFLHSRVASHRPAA